MSRLNQELSLLQGIGLLSTSLLGTGIFIIPALAATSAGQASLWGWLILIVLVLPIAFTFAQLGRHFPHAGGAPHLIGRAFGARMERVSALLFFVAVLPVGLPAALNIASGFWQALFDLNSSQLLMVQLGTLGLILLLGQRPAKASGLIQSLIALAIIATIGYIWWAGDLPLNNQPLLPLNSDLSLIPAAIGVMFWCFVGIEAFTHMGEEFKNPQRDFPIALLLGVLLAGLVYWACSVAVLSFNTYGDVNTDATSLPRMLDLLAGDKARWLSAIIGYLACFASMNVYIQGFSRLIWSLADEQKLPASLAQRNGHGVPSRALLLVVLICAVCATLAWSLSVSIDQLIRYANGNFILIYLLSMAAGWLLLKGIWRWVAGFSTLLCTVLLVCLGIDASYALGMFGALIIIDKLNSRRRAVQNSKAVLCHKAL